MKKRILGRYDGKKRSWFRQFKEFLALLLLIVLLFQLVVGVFFVKGDSMYPTLDDGELASISASSRNITAAISSPCACLPVNNT